VRKAFISVDFEGLPHVVSRHHLSPGRHLYGEARRIATRLTLHLANDLHENGFDVVVADSHGQMVAIEVEKLPSFVELVRGFPRPLAMVAGAEGCSIATFLGYHAKPGTPRATFDHTYSGAIIREVKVNGVAASEYLLNAYALGEMNIPLILVAGDRALMEDVETFTPWAARVVLKESLSRYSAKSWSLGRIEEELSSALKRGLMMYESGEAKPLKPRTPVRLEVSLTSTIYADIAEVIPGVKRIDGFSISYTARSLMEAYRLLELIVIAAYGIRYIETQ